MQENNLGSKPEPNDIGEATLKEKNGISAIWLLPFVALLIGVWLVVKGVINAPVDVIIQFGDGTGIIPGKTVVIYDGITVGSVASMALLPEGGVEVVAELDKSSAYLLTDETKVWLVKPELSLAGVSGLDTILSGNYITLIPGEGKPKFKFKALDEKPPLDNSFPGLHLTLSSDDLGSLGEGSPVRFKKLVVGYVDSYYLQDNAQSVGIHVFIQPEYEALVNSSSRFWLTSGINIEGNLNGIKIKTDSIRDMILGGLSFDTPVQSANPSKDGDGFVLHEDYERAQSGVEVRLVIDDAGSIAEGETEIRFRGVSIGKIGKVTLNIEDPYGPVVTVVQLPPASEPYLTEDAKFWISTPGLSFNEAKGAAGLLKGSTIELLLGSKDLPQKRKFEVLNTPPPMDYGIEGLHISLETKDLASIQRGSPIYYRRIQVGTVDTFKLLEDGETIKIDLHIEPEYDHLVKKHSKFWNASGIEITGGIGGFKINTQSLKTIIAGGISFSTDVSNKSKAAENGDTYKLYADEEIANDNGISIKLLFSNGDGLTEGTEIKYKGIQVGTIDKVYLNSKMNGVIAEAKMASTASNLATKGSLFWVVSPKLGLAETKNLDTLIGGHYISVSPSESNVRQTTFEGLLEAPTNLESKDEGLNIILTSNRLGSIKPGVNIFFRDIKVGEVTGFELAEASDQVLIQVTIQEQYQALVRENTVFWNASGIGVDFSLFSGAKIRTNSIESILAGGISFATPGTESGELQAPAVKEMAFKLYDEVKDEWLEWAPTINR